jgi:hypothetical protein
MALNDKKAALDQGGEGRHGLEAKDMNGGFAVRLTPQEFSRTVLRSHAREAILGDRLKDTSKFARSRLTL